MTTAVVILNWNGKKMLERFLPSVTACTTGDNEVIIADNGSTDDSLDFVRSQYPAFASLNWTRTMALPKATTAPSAKWMPTTTFC